MKAETQKKHSSRMSQHESATTVMLVNPCGSAPRKIQKAELSPPDIEGEILNFLCLAK